MMHFLLSVPGSYKKSELVLVETFINEGVDIKANVMPPAKKMRQNSEDEILPVVTVVENNTDAIEHFQRAHKCWSLLHRNPLLKQGKLIYLFVWCCCCCCWECWVFFCLFFLYLT